MVVAADLADWWDEKQKKREKDLEEWVQDNPQWWAVGLATIGATSMQFTAGFVDVLRLGQGAAEGGWGFGKDALRLLTLLGPLGRVGGMISRMKHLQALKLAVSLEGVTGPCTFTAANNAMSIISGRANNLFLTVKEAAKAVGTPLKKIAKVNGEFDLGAWFDEIAWFLEANGARIKQVTGLKKIEDVIAAASRENGVVVFAFRCVTNTGEEIHHTAIAVRTALGRVRFADYGGKFANTLEDLIRNLNYGAAKPGTIALSTEGGSSFSIVQGMKLTGLMEKAGALWKGSVFFVEGVTAIESNEEGVDFAIPVSVVAVPVPVDSGTPTEVIKSSFEAFEARKEGRPVLRMPEIHVNGRVPKAEYLTGVQFRLNAAGFGAGPVDGILGPRTTRAIRKFQETYKSQFNLRVDAIPGPETQQALVSLCGY